MERRVVLPLSGLDPRHLPYDVDAIAIVFGSGSGMLGVNKCVISYTKKKKERNSSITMRYRTALNENKNFLRL